MPANRPGYDELIERVEALEGQLRTGAFPLESIPLQALSERLTATMAPEGDSFLLPHATGPDSLAAVPAARLYNSAAPGQVYGTGVFTASIYDTITFNMGMQVDLANQPTRITIVRPGLYLFGAAGGFAACAAYHSLTIDKNGVSVASWESGGLADATLMNVTHLLHFAEGDYIRARMYQNSGGNCNSYTADTRNPSLWAIYLGLVEGL